MISPHDVADLRMLADKANCAHAGSGAKLHELLDAFEAQAEEDTRVADLTEALSKAKRTVASVRSMAGARHTSLDDARFALDRIRETAWLAE